MRGRVFSMHSAVISISQVVQYPAHDLPVTGLGFAPGDTGAQLGSYDLVAASADYKITLLKSQGEFEGAVGRRVSWIVSGVLHGVISGFTCSLGDQCIGEQNDVRKRRPEVCPGRSGGTWWCRGEAFGCPWIRELKTRNG